MENVSKQSYKQMTHLLSSVVLIIFISTGLLPVKLFAQENDVENTITAAREAARNNRNEESRELFRKAVAQSPSKRKELLRELADQMTYSGQSKDAVTLYKELLASNSLTTEAERRTKLVLSN